VEDPKHNENEQTPTEHSEPQENPAVESGCSCAGDCGSGCGCGEPPVDDTDDAVKPIEALGAPKGKVHYGGQAVIEGVMMRGPKTVAVAVRLPNGEIDVQSEPFISASRKNKFLRLPVIRGGLSLIESLALGIRALNYSASAAMEAEEVAAKAGGDNGAADASDAAATDTAAKDQAEPGASFAPEEAGWKTKLALTGTMVFAFGLGILFFFYIPLVLSEWLTDRLGSDSSILFNVVDGIIRVVFFLVYIWGISQWREMRRVFEYHGAEHKTIFCHEAELELTPENAQKFTTRHPRCGTSFLLIVMVTSILVFMLTGKPSTIAHRLMRLLLIPVIAGISYELMKLAAIRCQTRWARAVSAPGLWLQGITTKDPSDEQVEVAIAALAAAKGEPLAAAKDAAPQVAAKGETHAG
jgi:uncharacterized protein YqhQ